MRKKLFVLGLMAAVAFFLFGFTPIDEGKKAQSSPATQQVVEKCQDKQAKGECKEHKQGTCEQECKGQCDDKCKEECKSSCAEKHASGQCQGHDAGACKDKPCQKAQPKKSDKK